MRCSTRSCLVRAGTRTEANRSPAISRRGSEFTTKAANLWALSASSHCRQLMPQRMFWQLEALVRAECQFDCTSQCRRIGTRKSPPIKGRVDRQASLPILGPIFPVTRQTRPNFRNS
jgi:hypothetical protein